ncbi:MULTISPECIES: type II CRISPR-associated endonuclease Cas1 [unclassified Actinomyces]|uniref:type II CRISPR-associated endonuclease Cas1 n=1 Tax=unclassified Actinomyces TaxID=2609248 RepID=UPI0008A23508|nr:MULTISPECIES: type II CRISPR-associated endonuclease Cas1 [unclassified Actinomyces]MDU7239286.1 type II CRISPR-associated endonuclease Cas1 [Actinomyces sp.]OFR33327.1 subtype II CRISPR-associated endonuclease Cas1 [Actinomyces sp. HMSC065F11]
MSSNWRIIDCTQLQGEITAKRGKVVISPNKASPTEIAAVDVAVLLLGMGATISGAALHRLFQNDAVVLLCDWRGVPEAGGFGWSDHSRVAARRRAQASLSEPRRKQAWKILVKTKIQGQRDCLRALDKPEYVLLDRFAKSVRSGDTTNVEGQAARFYWKALCGSTFTRVPGEGGGINGMLDYAYTIARGHGIRAVLAAGLEPSLGIFHRNRANMFCLVDDLLEVFRPAIDLAVIELFLSGKCSVEEARADLVAIACGPFSDEGHSIPTVFQMLAQSYGRYVEGEIDKLDIPAWNPVKVLSRGG